MPGSSLNPGLMLSCCKGTWNLFQPCFLRRHFQIYGRAPDSEHSLKTQGLLMGPLTTHFKPKQTSAFVICHDLCRNVS